MTGSGSSLHAPSFYWASFNDAAGFDDGDLGHLIIGGQRSPFSLVGARRRTWPRPGEPHFVKQLPLPRYITTPIHGGGTYVVQRSARIFGSSTVRGARALVLLAPPGYPGGGLMSGHIIILWNRQGHGYFVSLHYDGPRTHRPYTFQERLAAALTIARSAQPPPR